MSTTTQTLSPVEHLYKIFSDLNGTRYAVRLADHPWLFTGLKQMCYAKSPSLTDPVAKDLLEELKQNKFEWCGAKEISNLIDVIETQLT